MATPTAAEKAYAALKELANLADLAARHGWRLDRCHSVLNEIAWHRSGHRIVVILTATGGIRRCGFGYATEPDPIAADWRYGADGGLTLAEGEGASPMRMLFWDRRSAGAAGLVGLVRRWLAATPGIGIGDLILFEGQWSPVTAVTAGHVTVIQGRGGRVQTVTVGRYEIEGHQFARPVYELSAAGWVDPEEDHDWEPAAGEVDPVRFATAIDWAAAGICVLQQSLPWPFMAVLPYAVADNRPAHRLLYAYALLTAHQHPRKAAKWFKAMYFMNPDDNMGARFHLGGNA